MATVGVRIGHGTLVRIGRGSTPTYTVMSGCEDVEFPDQPRADVDTTSMDSPDKTEESVPGLRPVADWSLTKHYVPGNAEDVMLNAIEASGETVILEITPPGAAAPSRWTGYAKQWKPMMPVKDAMKGQLVLRIMARVA